MKYYAVRIGRKNNVVVTSWAECFELVNGYPNALYKSFKNEALAYNFANQKTNIPQKEAKKKMRAHVGGSKVKHHESYTVDFTRKGECLHRGDYIDSQGNYRKNQCLIKHHATTVGRKYLEQNP